MMRIRALYLWIRWKIDKFDYTCCNSLPRTCGAILMSTALLSKHKENCDFLLDELRSSKKGKRRMCCKVDEGNRIACEERWQGKKWRDEIMVEEAGRWSEGEAKKRLTRKSHRKKRECIFGSVWILGRARQYQLWLPIISHSGQDGYYPSTLVAARLLHPTSLAAPSFISACRGKYGGCSSRSWRKY